MSGVKVSFEELGVKVSGVKVPLGSKCPGVKVSLGSKCPWGQSVFGVKMSVGSKCLWGQNGCEPNSATCPEKVLLILGPG